MQPKFRDHIKPVKAKGKTYLYFRTGQKDAQGREILKRLPDPAADNFGAVYGSLLAGRKRRENTGTGMLTVKDLCDQWEKTPRFRHYAPGTQKLYGIGIDYFVAQFATAPAGLIEQQDIQSMFDERADHPGAANSLLRTIGSLYAWARSTGKVTNNPTANIEQHRLGRHLEWPYRVLKAALEAKEPRVRLGVHLLYYTAQRIEDVVRMQWDHITEGVIYVQQMKTGSELYIPLHRDLAAELATVERSHAFIIPGSKPGKSLNQQTLRLEIQDWVRTRFGLEVVPHGLRKNAVIALLELPCEPQLAASISGQSLAVVEQYAKGRSQRRLARMAMTRWENAE